MSKHTIEKKSTPTRRLRQLYLLIPALILLLSLAVLSGCHASGDSPSGSETDTSGLYTGSPSNGTANETAHSPVPGESAEEAGTAAIPTEGEDLRTYYESLVADLQKELLEERLDRYISDFEYRARLAELQAELALLEAGGELDTTLPVSGKPDIQPGDQTVTTPQPLEPDEPTATISFRYGISNGEATIYEYLGSSLTVVVPASIEGCPVTVIADCAFQNSPVTSVLLPDSVVSLGWFAFSGCRNLESVTVPATVTSIGYDAFSDCPRLTLLCAADSYAAAWAFSYGIHVQYV